MNMNKKLGILLGIGLLLVPTAVLGNSFITSLVDGKTPSEAISIISEQFDVLLGRIDSIESVQEDIVATTTKIVEAQTDLKSSQITLQKTNEIINDKQKELNEAQNAIKDNQESINILTTALSESQDQLEKEQTRIANQITEEKNKIEIPVSRSISLSLNPDSTESTASKGDTRVLLADIVITVAGNTSTNLKGLKIDHFDTGVLGETWIEVDNGTIIGESVIPSSGTANILPINLNLPANTSANIKIFTNIPLNAGSFFAEQISISDVISDAGIPSGIPLVTPAVFKTK